MIADRGSWTGTSQAPVGISAATGEYRFLDLPGLAGEWALAPDGRHLAYWQTGETTGAPNNAYDPPMAAVAIYDTLTGDVQSHAIETDHGIESSSLVWSDADTLVLSYYHWVGGPGDSDMDQSSARFGGWYVWNLGEPEPAPMDMPDGMGSDVTAAGYGMVTGRGNYGDWFVDPNRQAAAFEARLSESYSGNGGPVLGPERRIAAVYGGPHEQTPNKVMVTVEAGSESTALPVPVEVLPGNRGTFEVLAWSDDQIVVERRPGTWRNKHFELASVSPVTGDVTRLVDLGPGNIYPGQVQYAADLFASPTIEAIQPPTPLDPRVVAAGMLLTIVAAVGVLIRWRRRVRP